MKKFTRSLEKHKGIVFASTSEEGVGAIHLRHKIPLYKLTRVCDSLGVSIHAQFKHKDHLLFRNKQGELVGTMVNMNLLLMPKYAKTKGESIEFARALLELMP